MNQLNSLKKPMNQLNSLKTMIQLISLKNYGTIIHVFKFYL